MPRTTRQCRGPRFGRTISSADAQVAAGLAFVAANPKALRPLKPPWAVPTVTVGNIPADIGVDAARHTIYVANGGDNTLSVIDSSKCNSANASNCATIATITVGPGPLYVVLDPTTDTIYTTTLGQNTVAVVNGATCNATITSGCGQTPAQTAAGGDTMTIDYANHGVYVSDFADSLIRVFNGTTCNAGNTSGCGQPPVTLVANFNPSQTAVDEVTHTVYVPLTGGQACTEENSALMIDAQGATAPTTPVAATRQTERSVGSGASQALIDPATETVYVENQESNSLSVINGATCNAIKTSGCANIPPALAIGNLGAFVRLDPNTHTLCWTHPNATLPTHPAARSSSQQLRSDAARMEWL